MLKKISYRSSLPWTPQKNMNQLTQVMVKMQSGTHPQEHHWLFQMHHNKKLAAMRKIVPI